ncbi:conserved hypothetical protein [Desulfurivibrio alkaliphilus AHT 2]|uniref:Serine aminopeptidase S33 domain-containing protein n=1 Tax=Desulfurivibrio alkaliphilus (strain DSM 19089 / UNIQEM U267 / AHT2) TaxID=589865 RepID=D6Z464_DESAT|nr:conserved hypothetical protein [Desulfurivibrio alkaliphilus AHT 2]
MILRILLSIATIAALSYLGFGLLLFLLQERMVHLPQVPGRELVADPGDVGLDWHEIEIISEDGLRLHGWHLPGPSGAPTLLFFHGNAGNISHRLDSLLLFRQLGLEVVIFDYRGYGRSEGRAREAGLHRDARAAADWLFDSLQADPARSIFFGRSLGGSLAASAARHRPPAALILESTLLSAQAVAADLYPLYPTRLLTRLQYDTGAYLAEVARPVLIIHSPDDELIPYRHAEELARIAGPRGELLTIRGGHNHGFLLNQELYLDGLQSFIHRHLPPAEKP